MKKTKQPKSKKTPASDHPKPSKKLHDTKDMPADALNDVLMQEIMKMGGSKEDWDLLQQCPPSDDDDDLVFDNTNKDDANVIFYSNLRISR